MCGLSPAAHGHLAQANCASSVLLREHRGNIVCIDAESPTPHVEPVTLAALGRQRITVCLLAVGPTLVANRGQAHTLSDE